MKKHNASPNLAAVSFISLAIFIFAFVLVAAKTPTVTAYNSQVLGDSDSKEADKKAAEATGEQQQKQQEQQKEQEQKKEQAQKTPEPTSQVKSEIETQQGDKKVKMKVEDNGNTKIEIEKPNGKFKLEVKNGDVEVKTENKKGELVDVSKKEQESVDDILKEKEIDIATEEGKVKFEQHGVRVETDFPLSVDPGSRGLVVTTPEGQKSVSILPDQVIQNMLNNNIISASPSAATHLEMREGKLVYRVEGQKDLRVLGVFPIQLHTTTFVSSDNGQLVAQEQSLLSKILSLFSK